MSLVRSFSKWLLKGRTKEKHDGVQSEDMEANHDVASTPAELQRKRYRKFFASFGCALLGILLFILFTFGYVELTTKLLRHLSMPKFLFDNGGAKSWHRNDYPVRGDNGLPSITKHELPVLASHKIDISFRPKRPELLQHPPVKTFYDPRALRPNEMPNATTNQQQRFLLSRSRENFPKEESAEPVHQEKAKLVNSQQKVAQRIYMERRRPNRHIPVIRYHPKYVITNTNDDFDDHDEIIM
ncbi:hypothetical protein MPTK1_5g17810 [Marchantia polymorpha subsp. ruderalis]|uniref:Uncharacterized protein n=2 Tax=Marchantia polymorpha TaxID=3197 RepID=A0A176WQE2_MARPO|nr:hypothetical protein AXG93_4858s1010 [Marchantia polymorpha subsp. ruderalis]PTQ33941.1 hypothetical protein MARPO_0084s0031 [Marchantia polymorpha]BBN12153.1 hypothetical protein Mp_5g17810 [Marchantia polymorpha subsp. ruderalis]|eukprot:PTQ33941.1 hypothetical protein MARPO_0084s0031 [Marchantia polymorpha]